MMALQEQKLNRCQRGDYLVILRGDYEFVEQAQPREDMCLRKFNEFCCTRINGHEGKHAAHSGSPDAIAVMWDDSGKSNKVGQEPSPGKTTSVEEPKPTEEVSYSFPSAEVKLETPAAALLRVFKWAQEVSGVGDDLLVRVITGEKVHESVESTGSLEVQVGRRGLRSPGFKVVVYFNSFESMEKQLERLQKRLEEALVLLNKQQRGKKQL